MASASGIYRLFKILYQVAQFQIEASLNLETMDPEILNHEFNDYLSILDFAMRSPQGVDNGVGGAQAAGGDDGAGEVGCAFADGGEHDLDFDGFGVF
jgi:hypothetical protein